MVTKQSDSGNSSMALFSNMSMFMSSQQKLTKRDPEKGV